MSPFAIAQQEIGGWDYGRYGQWFGSGLDTVVAVLVLGAAAAVLGGAIYAFLTRSQWRRRRGA